jgi:hypothetical protein
MTKDLSCCRFDFGSEEIAAAGVAEHDLLGGGRRLPLFHRFLQTVQGEKAARRVSALAQNKVPVREGKFEDST